MKVSNMAAETTAAGAGLLWKLGAGLGIGVLGALVMAAVDPPKTRRALFLQAFVAGAGASVFGPAAVSLAARVVPLSEAELLIPVLFLTGALSWGAAAALARFRQLVAERAAAVAADKVGLK